MSSTLIHYVNSHSFKAGQFIFQYIPIFFLPEGWLQGFGPGECCCPHFHFFRGQVDLIRSGMVRRIAARLRVRPVRALRLRRAVAPATEEWRLEKASQLRKPEPRGGADPGRNGGTRGRRGCVMTVMWLQLLEQHPLVD